MKFCNPLVMTELTWCHNPWRNGMNPHSSSKADDKSCTSTMRVKRLHIDSVSIILLKYFVSKWVGLFRIALCIHFYFILLLSLFGLLNFFFFLACALPTIAY